jgi:hypothetical protein
VRAIAVARGRLAVAAHSRAGHCGGELRSAQDEIAVCIGARKVGVREGGAFRAIDPAVPVLIRLLKIDPARPILPIRLNGLLRRGPNRQPQGGQDRESHCLHALSPVCSLKVANAPGGSCRPCGA